MGVEVLLGKPQKDGEYVGYIQDRTQPEWVRPIILHWSAGTWYYSRSDREFMSPVFCWAGPLPVGRLDDPCPPAVQEFDL